MLRMALRSLRREWRSGELAVLWVSVAVAISALTGVGFLVDRIGRAVQVQANEVLAADARLESPEPLANELRRHAQELQLRTARLTTMLSVVYNGDTSQLANIRAATGDYPLRGTLMVAGAPFGAGTAVHEIPARGDCWPDSRLAAALGVSVGGSLNVGARALRVSRILIGRPDQGSTFVEFAPALLINDADLAATQLVQPASRMEYLLLLSGSAEAIASYQIWFKARARSGEKLQTAADASPQIGEAARRAGRFLALASLVAVLLCAVAVAMSARCYLARHLDVVALMKTLGARRGFVLGVHALQLLILAVAAALLGSLGGWLTQLWLLHALAGFLRTDLPPAGWVPVIVGLVVAVAMLAGFALPTLLQLTRVPALRVLRRDTGPPPLRLWLALVPAAMAVMGIIYGTLGQWTLSLLFMAALAVTIAILAAGGWGLVQLAGRVRGRANLALRHGLANLSRRRVASMVQVVAFGLGITLLLVLTTLRHDLIHDWRATLPPGVPNYFFVNIPADQRENFRDALGATGAQLERMLPMVRGRLLSINGIATGERAKHSDLAEREQNLTWSNELGDDNRITAGRWWTKDDSGRPLVSLASEFQESLGLKLGDRLLFDIAGERIEARVASFRKVKWDSFKPNFFIVFPPGLLDFAAGSYMTSARYEPAGGQALTALVRRFPSVSIFNVGDLLAQVRAVIDKAATAVQSVFAFTLLAGVTVLLAAVQASRDERRYETAILRALGASRGMLLRSTLAEFAGLGSLAGVLAATVAAFGGLLLARELELRYRFDALMWLTGVASTVLIMAVSGWLAVRPVLDSEPRSVLN
ncbi:MAG TPA: FtsX-like permease family protein [Steroidobacteraceae bacterium]|nr:FtsX-like permease family protein [Steroidobacteraceae bacterium]